jgi:hypothetical protein
MKIQPVAHNAIEIILDDGTTFKLHDTCFHGDKSYLFINKIDNTPITVDSMDLEPVCKDQLPLIRIS